MSETQQGVVLLALTAPMMLAVVVMFFAGFKSDGLYKNTAGDLVAAIVVAAAPVVAIIACVIALATGRAS